MALLSFQDVNVAFGGLPLLDRVHLQVEKGERVCLLGRKGEGKTTILRLISGERHAGLKREIFLDLTFIFTMIPYN
ncbi:MAG: ATP-binding cassette domain-containing protein [Pseudomonadota bacterium]